MGSLVAGRPLVCCKDEGACNPRRLKFYKGSFVYGYGSGVDFAQGLAQEQMTVAE